MYELELWTLYFFHDIKLSYINIISCRLRQVKNEPDTAKQKQNLMQKQIERKKAPEMQAVQEVAEMESELADIEKSRAERLERWAKLTKELAELEHKLAHLQEFHEQLRLLTQLTQHSLLTRRLLTPSKPYACLWIVFKRLLL